MTPSTHPPATLAAATAAAPFVVAVSGHRRLDADCLAAVIAQLDEALALIAACLPDSPLVFLSPLADGADQLFASAVLRLRGSLADPGRVRLIVPLPLALDDYCVAQGEGEGDADGFRARIAPLLAQADGVLEIPACDWPLADAGLTVENRPYVALGRYLARHSHLLVAVWDGATMPAPPGGTAAVVAAVLGAAPRRPLHDAAAWLAEPDPGHVLQVSARRTGSAALAKALPGLQGLGAAGSLAPADCIAAAGAELDALNRRHRRALAADAGLAARIDAAAGALLQRLGGRQGEEQRGEPGEPALLSLARAFAIADDQAARAKRSWRRSWLAIALAAVLAGSSSLLRLASETYGELIETLSFGAGAVIAIGVYLWIARAGERNAYLAYRSLAEGLRVQLAWLAAGSAERVSDHFLRKQRGDVGWVRKCIDSLCLQCGALQEDAPAPTPAAQVLRGWIGEQLAYLDGPHAARRRREQLRSARWGHRLLLAGLACAVAGVALSIHHGTVSSWTLLLLIVAMKLLTDLGAAWVSFDGKMAHAETLQQMAHLRAVYGRALAALEAIETTAPEAPDAPGARAAATSGGADPAMALLLALGREVLEEEGNWMRVYMERRLAWHGR